MTTDKMDDKDIERMIDIIGDGELSARRKNGCSKKACGRFMRACGKWPTQPLCSATQMGKCVKVYQGTGTVAARAMEGDRSSI